MYNTRKRKGISPVLSVLLMIVVAVAGALVTYAWSMGYLDTTTARAGRAIQIQSVALDDTRQGLTIYVQNVGQGAVNFDSTGEEVVYINGGLVPCTGIEDPLPEGDTMALTVNLTTPLGANDDVKIKIAGMQGTAIQATVIPDTTSGGSSGGPGATTYSITETIVGSGSISYDSAAPYDSGTTVELTAVPGSGYEFTGWSGDLSGSTNPETLVMTSDKDVTATFSLIPPPDVQQISSSDSGFSGVQAGDLLIVIPNHRTSTFTTGGETCTATDYTQVEVASFMTSTGDRRAIALLYKIADGSETGSVTCTWGSGAGTYTTIYQIYRGASSYSVKDSGVNNGVSGEVGSIDIPSSALSSGTTANVLTLAAIVTRDSPGSVSMTDLSDQDSAGTSCYTFTEYNYGNAVTESSVSLSTDRRVSGLLVQFECE